MRKLSLLALLAHAAVTNAQLLVGFGDGPGPIYQVNTHTGVATQVSAPADVWGMAYDRSRNMVYTSGLGVLYQAPYGPPPLQVSELGRVFTAGPTFIVPIGLGWNPFDGSLYATTNSTEAFYRVNPDALSADLVYQPGPSWYLQDLDFDPATGKMYAINVNINGQASGLYSVDLAAQSMTLVTPFPNQVLWLDGLAIGDGRAYMVNPQNNMAYVYNLGAHAYEQPIALPYQTYSVFNSAAFVPEPGALGLLLPAGLLVLRRRAVSRPQ